MKQDPEGHALFRRWLIEKLKRSRWVAIPGDSVERVSRRLGVHPEALAEAQAEFAEERRKEGKAPAALGTGRAVQGRRKQIDLDLPEVIQADWQRYCQLRDLSSSVLLRSVIHTLLSGPENPTWTGKGWWYRGRMHRLSNYKKVAAKGWWPHNAKTDLTPGAVRALTIRADTLGCSYTALVRGAMIDLLEGRTRRLNIVTSVATMWEDENRYWTGKPPR